MKLTSYNRMLRFIAPQDGTSKTSDANSKRDIETWINSVSNNIEKYLSRSLEKKYREEYLDIDDKNQKELFVKAYPIASISFVQLDTTGQHTTNTTNILDDDDYYISSNSDAIVIDETEGYKTLRGVKVGYTGGLAEHGYNSTYTLASISGTILNTHYVLGETSYALGKVSSIAGTTLVNEVLYGVFETGESLHFHTTEEGSDNSGVTAILNAKTIESIAEKYPDLTSAVEIEVRYKWKHKHDFENINVNKDGTSQRVLTTGIYGLQNQTLQMLYPYKNLLIW